MENDSDSKSKGMGYEESTLYNIKLCNIKRIIKIWREYASGMCLAHGVDDPGYKVMRKCINDLSLILPDYDPRDYME